MKKLLPKCALLGAIGAALVGAALVASDGAASRADTGVLALRVVLAMKSHDAECPPGTPPSIDCHPREGHGVFPGLGKVSESYVYRVGVNRPECSIDTYRVFGYQARLIVAGKGEIELVVGERPECFASGAVLNPDQSFTITGGSGVYAGASGRGTLHHLAHYGDPGAVGQDTWEGTLDVPGLKFDLTPPTLSGASNKTVRGSRAKRRRVTYSVTARDEVDGVVPVSCRPKSGSLFKIGGTIVRCSATDTSENTRTATFRVTVKANR